MLRGKNLYQLVQATTCQQTTTTTSVCLCDAARFSHELFELLLFPTSCLLVWALELTLELASWIAMQDESQISLLCIFKFLSRRFCWPGQHWKRSDKTIRIQGKYIGPIELYSTTTRALKPTGSQRSQADGRLASGSPSRPRLAAIPNNPSLTNKQGQVSVMRTTGSVGPLVSMSGQS